MSRRLALVALSLLLLVLPGAASAQDFASEGPSPEKLDPAKEKKVFDLLQTISEQVTSLHSPSNRVRAECLIADPLWAGANLFFAGSGPELRDRAAAHRKTNELIVAAALLDGFEATYLNDGEWIIPGMNNLGNVVGNLNQTLALLARLDFDRTRSLANQIQRPELRLTSELEIARGTLGGRIVNLQMGGRRMMTIN